MVLSAQGFEMVQANLAGKVCTLATSLATLEMSVATSSIRIAALIGQLHRHKVAPGNGPRPMPILKCTDTS